MIDLKTIYRRALEACRPERLVAAVVEPGMPGAVVAIGKCAGALLDGVSGRGEAFAVIPEGYPAPRTPAEVHAGGHPRMTAASFEAGRALVRFVDAHPDVLFLISGGGSACVDLPLAPWFEERDLIEVNARLVTSSLPIAGINCVRKHLSAIKGGRLGARVRGRSVSLIYSDVSSGALGDVASGPTLPDATTKGDALAILGDLGGFERIAAALGDDACPETVRQIPNAEWKLIADNDSLTAAAASAAAWFGFRAVHYGRQVEGGISEAAATMAGRARLLRAGEILIAGGEPTVSIRGDGKGGRCSELAVRVALAAEWSGVALFASSDGVDGNSGAAGVLLSLPAGVDRAAAERELARSNSMAVAAEIGEVLPAAATGNNLRDLYLLSRS